MMLTLNAPVMDVSGSVTLRPLPTSDMDEITRRLNRVPTLDGGAVVNDSGHSPADRTFRVRWKITNEAQFRSVQRLVRFYTVLTVSRRDGVFRAAPRSVTQRRGEGDLELLIIEELT
jgi:hypothetical protein